MNASIATIDEAARIQFELAWQQGKPQSIEQCLPHKDAPLYLATLEEMVQIEIEMKWKAWSRSPNSPQPDLIETYLVRFPELKQSKIILRLIEQECRSRRLAGNTPNELEYQKRFPELTIQEISFSKQAVAVKQPLPSNDYLQNGKQLGRYQLAHEHSRGSFGIVWKADDLMLGRTVALKQLKGNLSARPEYRHRFLAEARITAQLQHPGIVPIHEMGDEESSSPFYTMNMVSGQTFAEAIEAFHHNKTANEAEQALEWQRLITAFLAVVRTMAFVHSKGVLHRDLKPANIILGQYGETLILDWGLAKVMKQDNEQSDEVLEPIAGAGSDATQQGTVIGTPAYMSPEQAAGLIDEVNPSSDVFSLGVMLYELLTGQRPYQGEINAVLLQKVQKVNPTPPSQLRHGIAKPLEAICLKAMSLESSERYVHADLLRADLERYLADEPVGAYPEPWWQRVARWMRHHKALSSSLAVALLLLLLGSLVGYSIYSQAQATRLSEEHERFQQLSASIKADEDAAQAELKAGRFSSSVALLERASKAATNNDELQASLKRLTARYDRVKRIAEFTRLADLAEQHAAMDRDDISIRSAERALQLVNVLENLPDWWQHLPVEDLESDQVIQVREDVSRLLLLLGLQRTKLAILTFFGGSKHYQSALELIPAIQNYHHVQWGGPAHSGLILENFCHYQLGYKDKLRPLTTWTPRGPSDHFFIGICHFWLGSQTSNLKVENILPASVHRDIRALGGIDLNRPLDTSLSMLRMAATLEPRRYWTYNWLGWCMLLRNDTEGAAQAFSSAIAIRPTDSFSYLQRGTVLMQQMYRSQHAQTLQPLMLGISNRIMPAAGSYVAWFNDAHLMQQSQGLHLKSFQGILQRVILGLEMGMSNETDADEIYFLHSRCCTWANEPVKGFASFSKGVEQCAPQQLISGETYQDVLPFYRATQDLTQFWLSYHAGNMNAERWTVFATAYWKMGQHPAAQQAISQAVKLDPNYPKARILHGILALRDNNKIEPQAAVVTGNLKPEDKYLLHGWRARLYELQSKREEALAEYRVMSGFARYDWQNTEVRLGEARVLAQLGRLKEALEEVKQVEQYAPKTAATARSTLKK